VSRAFAAVLAFQSAETAKPFALTDNTGQTIFYLCFLSAELPSQLISKKVGVDKWVPAQMMAWSTVAACQVALNSKASFFVTRGLLGLIEGGFIADMILYMSYYYSESALTSDFEFHLRSTLRPPPSPIVPAASQLTIRLSWFWVSYSTTTIVSSFLAAGLLKMRGVHGLEGWRWLFLIEGIITFMMGLFALFYLPPSPTQTASWFRGEHGWFSE
jgi:hypothetical protein